MKVWMNKKEFHWFKTSSEEGRTRQVLISTYRRFKDDREIELELIEK